MNAENVSSNKALKLQLDDAKFWYEQAEELAKKGKHKEALFSLKQVIATNQNNCAAWVLQGVVLLQRGRYNEALASCEQALVIHPNNQQAWLVKGAALNYLGKYNQSYASYDQALGIKRQSKAQRLTQKLKSFLRLSQPSSTTDKVILGEYITD